MTEHCAATSGQWGSRPRAPQLDDKPRSLARSLGYGPYFAAMGLHDLLRNIKAVTGRVYIDPARLFAASTLGEEFLHVLRCNADARIADREPDVMSLTFQFYRYRTARCVLDRVVDE